MIRETKISVDTTGSDGSATGRQTTDAIIAGEILAIYHNFHSSCPNTADVTVTERPNGADRQTLQVETDSATDVMRYPRRGVEDSAEATVEYASGFDVRDRFVVHGEISVAVVQANALTACIVTSIIYDDGR